jgi:predicted transcriptional regulator
MIRALIGHGLTQVQIAAEAGVTQPTVSRALAGKGVTYENGKKIETVFRAKVTDRRTGSDRRKKEAA